MPRDSSQQRLALLTYGRLMRAANALRMQAARQLDSTGLTLSQFAVLEALYHLGPMSLSEVARKILTTGGNLTMVAGNLEKQGLVEPQVQRRRCAGLHPVADAEGKEADRRNFSRACWLHYPCLQKRSRRKSRKK